MMTATPSPTLSGGSPLDLAWEEDQLILQVQQTPHSRPRLPPHHQPPRPLKAVAENTALWTVSVTTFPTILTEDWAVTVVVSITAGSVGRDPTYPAPSHGSSINTTKIFLTLFSESKI